MSGGTALAVDAFVSSARRKGSAVVVGLDPDPRHLPPELLGRERALTESVREFCLGILEAVEPEVAAVKLQLAYFERLGPEGMGVYADLIEASRALGLPTIADAKRGDVGHVAAAYAEAHLSVYGATGVTVNPFMGADAVEPFLGEARRLGRGGGVFVLVASSNSSAPEVQDSSTPPLYETASRLVASLGEAGEAGYLDAGAVVGATRPKVGRRVRELLLEALFLAPGYGAQKGDASGVKALLDAQGAGVLVNSSRGILRAFEGRTSAGGDYRSAAREAARRMREDLEAAGVRA
ncbi:MAG: Orotidine 5'-phosphate decarboxylase [uncultured Rubrobacteraceae bacterium]|uniref:Orotidine-5'-phosphate decarboxylase n=1 Tax=uncultured Rubrobacteraceae bacterium TaxID=349277 RepID=A0A6J4Q8T0_9ACTN|nr:MAG: Orotidine 5'-phosphate decarboxylase [uncultured Rubrobacteraceae bacterium]